MIEARNLFRIEAKLKRGNKTIPVKSIEKNYVLSWILIGIAGSKLSDLLSFKGGTALKKFYFPDYRFSEDMDFTVLKEITIENIEEMLEDVYVRVLNLSNIRLAFKKKEKHSNSYTFFINFSGPLGADLTRGEIKLDFTVNEKLINQPVVKTLLREYEEYQDIPDNISLKVYSLEEIFMEKILSILDARRNEPRDIYDLWYLISNESLEYIDLGKQIKEKGIHKDIASFDIIKVLDRKEKNYKNLWQVRLDKYMIDLPYFENVYRELKRSLKPLNRTLTDDR
jgi:predicted nucleotidyltransferase component of viral defense system